MKQLTSIVDKLEALKSRGRGGLLMVRCQNGLTSKDAENQLTAQSAWQWHTLDGSALASGEELVQQCRSLCPGPTDVCLVTKLPSAHAVNGNPEFFKALNDKGPEIELPNGPAIVFLITIQDMRALNQLAPKFFKAKAAFVAWPVTETAEEKQRKAQAENSSDEARALQEQIDHAVRPGSHTSVAQEDAMRIIALMDERAAAMEESADKAHTILRIALIQSAQGLLEEARMTGTRAARLFKKLNDMQGLAQCYEIMGSLAERRGNVRMSIEWMSHACEAWRSCGNETRIAETNAKLGQLCYISADHEGAAKHLQEAIAIDEALGNEAKVAAGLRRLGMLAMATDKFPVAEKLFRDAKDICKRLHDEVGLSRCTHQLGSLFEQAGDPNEALRWHNQSLALKKKLGDRLGLATSFHHLGNTYFKLRDFDAALKHYAEALTIEEQEGDKQGQANTLLQMGEVAHEQKRFEDQIFYFSSARYLYRSMEAALEGILTNRIRRLEDFLDPQAIRDIERDAERRMRQGISTEAAGAALTGAMDEAMEAMDSMGEATGERDDDNDTD